MTAAHADLDPVAVTMTMTRTAAGAAATEPVPAGTGADCLGDPLAALAWLATEARDRGAPLRAGDIVLSGALGPMVAVAPGDAFHAEIVGPGTVSALFTTLEVAAVVGIDPDSDGLARGRRLPVPTSRHGSRTSSSRWPGIAAGSHERHRRARRSCRR